MFRVNIEFGINPAEYAGVANTPASVRQLVIAMLSNNADFPDMRTSDNPDGVFIEVRPIMTRIPEKLLENDPEYRLID